MNDLSRERLEDLQELQRQARINSHISMTGEEKQELVSLQLMADVEYSRQMTVALTTA